MSEGPCDIVCERAIVDHSAEDEGNDHDWKEATDNANQVLDGMRDDLMACYKKRLVAKPSAHAFMTLSVLVGPDGKVKNVETTGGALLGEETRKCIADRVAQGSFAPPKRGGTLRVNFPFTLRRVEEGQPE